jgi:hypothetical protein
MKTLQEGTVNLSNACDIYSGLVDLFKAKEPQIKIKVEKGGYPQKEIKHGDYGYFLHEGNKITRFFARTKNNRIEAFCTKHIDKCRQGADVNKNPGRYLICGSLFD